MNQGGLEISGPRSTGGNRPPDVLHVYYIEGRFPPEAETCLGASFLGNWREEEASCFLFFSAEADQQVRAVLDSNPGLRLVDSYRFGYDEWQGGRFEPLRVGPICVYPAWWDGSWDTDERLRILLDPGVVFGTGLHPTTRDCLRAMVRVMEREVFGTVLDLGTGTGVLALAGARLGAERALAVDLNPLCVETAERNVRLNGLDGRVEVIQGRAEDFCEIPADLAVANLHLDVVNRLLQPPAFLDREWLILSGLMRSGVREIKEGLPKDAIIVKEYNYDMIWHTLLIKGLS